jgi:hypothetical protein
MDSEKPTIIVDSAYLYRLVYEVLFLLPWMTGSLYLALPDLINLIFEYEGEKRISFLILAVLTVIWLHSVWKRYKDFNSSPPKFTFTEKIIAFDNVEDNGKHRKKIEKKIDDIAHVSYIIIAENIDRHGFINHKRIFKKLFQTDIGDLFVEAFMHGSNILYWLVVGLPSRVIRFLLKKEPLGLIWKNLCIEFKDGEAFIINTNSLQELQKIEDIFVRNNIAVSKVPQLTIIMHKDKKFSVSSYN